MTKIVVKMKNKIVIMIKILVKMKRWERRMERCRSEII